MKIIIEKTKEESSFFYSNMNIYEIKNEKRENRCENEKENKFNKINYNQENKERKNKHESFELINYIDSGSESNVYNLTICNRKPKGQIMRKKSIMKLVFKSKNEREDKKEIYISSILKNINIIDFYRYSENEKDKTYYTLMDYAKYGNLRNFQRKTIKRNYFSESMICFLAFQILKDIHYCHKCKIEHMDIKSQNIVIDDYLNRKLIDFSIPINYKNRNNDHEIKLPFKGTNFYKSKEELNSEKIKIKDLNKVDLYAFGVVLYNLAFGTYPYGLCRGDEDNYDIILEKIENGKLIFPNTTDYSSHFLDLISKLLEKDISKRIDIYEALNHYWVKGANILLDEKEKYNNIGIFISYLLTEHIRLFNNYIKKNEEFKFNKKQYMPKFILIQLKNFLS